MCVWTWLSHCTPPLMDIGMHLKHKLSGQGQGHRSYNILQPASALHPRRRYRLPQCLAQQDECRAIKIKTKIPELPCIRQRAASLPVRSTPPAQDDQALCFFPLNRACFGETRLRRDSRSSGRHRCFQCVCYARWYDAPCRPFWRPVPGHHDRREQGRSLPAQRRQQPVRLQNASVYVHREFIRLTSLL